ncbi:sulfite exporter TauE/SafE family protein [Ornithinimicrobium faecis]|uniref:Probable membrane transporter protein n=1 Tax=Ornithinimicrobium faecis TaxID=2934158 RepID=A0ABY4YNQ5_9MICO|nr:MULTISPECIES: sulfite exporter TauE/SafE family protein [unclassified Ornithinimicrobium]USQ78242.1 sulfite exporter TauE/SafE family protein [Ornithinimicrobium sp. HY1793]
MSAFEISAIILAGMWAGAINTVVGSGTLVTFPTLLFFGYPAVSANISNSLGLVAGGLTGAWGYRREIRPLRDLLIKLAPASFVGAIIGALLLLVLPESAFEAIVPILIALALVLVVLGPRINAWAARHHADSITGGRLVVLLVGVMFAGMYGGYFGAAQGVLLIGMMSVLLPNGLQEINGAKNVLGLIVNFTAAMVFLVIDPAQVNWAIVGLVAIGAFFGGLIGARVGRLMPPWLLRATIVIIGVVAIVVLLV